MKTIFFTILVLLVMENFQSVECLEGELQSQKPVPGSAVSAVEEAHPWDQHGRLRVSSNGHYLEHADGTDFFLLADTSWRLTTLSDAKLQEYLDNRKEHGFNAVQFHTYDGDYPFNGKRPYTIMSPHKSKWQIIDNILQRAAERGMYIIIFPQWGRWLSQREGWKAPYTHLYQFGQWLGNRYKKNPNVIYCVAGEYTHITAQAGSSHIYDPLDNTTWENWIRRLGQGIASTKHADQLITIHGGTNKCGSSLANYSASYHFHGESWLDFYMNQSWHWLCNIESLMLHDYNLKKPEPAMNAEGPYEGAPYVPPTYTWSSTGWGSRIAAWYSVFNGSLGYSYGHVATVYMCTDIDDIWGTDGSNYLHPSAMNAEGAADMQHVKNLCLAKGLTYVPDQSVIAGDLGSKDSTPPTQRYAVKDSDGDFAYVYLPQGGSVSVNMAKIDRKTVTARWFDPRSGFYQLIGTYSNTGRKTFTTASSGRNNDWVLVLEGE
jgi:hypothetical protein